MDFDKRRLMYNQSEDLYYIAYNILLIVFELDCISSKKQFKDYRKLVFLITIISDDRMTSIFTDYYGEGIEANKNIKLDINRAYYNSIENITLVRYLLMILESKNIIELVTETNKTNLFISDVELCKKMITDKRFENDRLRVEKIRRKANKISSINYITLVNNLFKRNGVAIWEN